MGFKIYRIICTLTGKALIHGSNHPVWFGGQHPSGRALQWHHRGSWSEAGAFWRTENSIRKHLRNLCADWVMRSAPSRFPRYAGQRDYWHEVVPGSLDWSRLKHLRVEQVYVTKHATTLLDASDFMGIAPAPETRPGSQDGQGPIRAMSAPDEPLLPSHHERTEG